MEISPVDNYKYVNLSNSYMKFAYNWAKKLYEVTKWNDKTTPVAVLVDKWGNIRGWGIANAGLHAINGKCERLGEAGTPYDTCPLCREEMHAEVFALSSANSFYLKGGSVYLYGHYKYCDACKKKLQIRGIRNFYLLENSRVLFDRHHPGTVIGKQEQFKD